MSKKKTRVRLELTRRDFLLVAGAAAGSVVAAQALTTGVLSPFSSLKQQQVEGVAEAAHGGAPGLYHWGMVINLDKCIGCSYCQRACSATNDVAEGMAWNIVVEEKTSAGNTFYFSRPCLHCEHAPCVEVCPVRATYRRPDGLVVMDYDRCIGCRYCQVACPYDARRFNWERRHADDNRWIPTWGIPEVVRRPRGVVEKCTFCIQRIHKAQDQAKAEGREVVDGEFTTACAQACPANAIVFGRVDNPETLVAQLISKHGHGVKHLEELGTLPSVTYLKGG